MSMQDYDIPLRRRTNSAQMSCSPPINASPPIPDGDDSGSTPETPNSVLPPGDQDFAAAAAANSQQQIVTN